MPNDYQLARQARKEPENRSRIVIEPAPEAKQSNPNGDRPAQQHWPPRVTDPNSYDRNVIDPWSPSYPKKAGAAEPEKKV